MDSPSDANNVSSLVLKLCRLIASPDEKRVVQIHSAALHFLSENASFNDSLDDEFAVADKIRRKFLHAEKIDEAARFNELHNKLQNSLIRNKRAVLAFMEKISQVGQENKKLSTVEQPSVQLAPISATSVPPKNDTRAETLKLFLPLVTGPDSAPVHACKQPSHAQAYGSFSVHEIIRELIYAFHGIEGRIIRWDPAKEKFLIDSKARVPYILQERIRNLAVIGQLFSRIQKVCNRQKGDRSLGLAAQSFITALQENVAEYYRLLSALEDQLKAPQGDTPMEEETLSLTLMRLSVWMYEPRDRLKYLLTLVEDCKGLKGGALVSMIYKYLNTGNPAMQLMVRDILNKVCKPLFVMILHWVFEGDLTDPYSEFFIAADIGVGADNMWHQKYRSRKSMIPSFFTNEQVTKLVTTGKSVRFLREVCHDKASIPGLELLKDKLKFSEGSLANIEWEVLNQVYKVTSKHLLQVLCDKYKMKCHLQALREYLLLGQGDFVHHLMYLLEPELNKPASSSIKGNLTHILDKCIRSTNSQYDDPDVLKRLDIRTEEGEANPGDMGWDIFVLHYHVDGPLSIIMSEEVKLRYAELFKFLWRSKRMEWMLCKLKQEQITEGHTLRYVPELAGLLHQAGLLLSEMIHFVQQMAYYVTFEVMACCWEQLRLDIEEAQAFDDILTAHHNFLETVRTRLLLDEQSKNLKCLLIGVQNCFKDFEQDQEALHDLANYTLKNSQRRRETFDAENVVETDHLTKIKEAKTRLGFKHRSYQRAVNEFLAELSKHVDPTLQGLSFRLDFNEFYHRQDSRLSMSLTFRHRRLTTVHSHHQHL